MLVSKKNCVSKADNKFRTGGERAHFENLFGKRGKCERGEDTIPLGSGAVKNRLL